MPRTSVNPASYCRTSLLRAETSGFGEEEEVWGGVRLRGGAWKVCGEEKGLPGEMARKENGGYDACCAQGSSSPCDDGGENRTNKVCFASSSSWTCRRKSNRSAQIQIQITPMSIIVELPRSFAFSHLSTSLPSRDFQSLRTVFPLPGKARVASEWKYTES